MSSEGHPHNNGVLHKIDAVAKQHLHILYSVIVVLIIVLVLVYLKHKWSSEKMKDYDTPFDDSYRPDYTYDSVQWGNSGGWAHGNHLESGLSTEANEHTQYEHKRKLPKHETGKEGFSDLSIANVGNDEACDNDKSEDVRDEEDMYDILNNGDMNGGPSNFFT